MGQLEPAAPFGAAATPEDRGRFLGWLVKRLTLAALFALMMMAGFFFLAHAVDEHETRRLDGMTQHFFTTHQQPLLHLVMKDISWLAGPVSQTAVWLICVVVLSATGRFWPRGLTMLVAGVGGAAVIVALKHLFHRARPEQIYSHLGYSFPSGHSFFALTIYGLLAYWLTRKASFRRRTALWVAAIAAILLVGFSRVFLGEHYASDVIGGYAVAFPWLWGCLDVTRRVNGRGRAVENIVQTTRP